MPPNGADPPDFPPSAKDVVLGLPLMAGKELRGGESAHEVWFSSSFTHQVWRTKTEKWCLVKLRLETKFPVFYCCFYVGETKSTDSFNGK